ncbi:V-type proton ATPase 116 kDa subunit a isoform 3 [Platysternon megacephalum]|uniref:V-type proton ATPase 116 kDa subunit a isoform 3 n=1 Tax=Platysternon megacephalum TaxID=55544 RepID=A0A4D9DIR7_9SAUR|nr:V-type proton ATPase 116 kDa subunit a isoform 3 [Platysternon megacephalum]
MAAGRERWTLSPLFPPRELGGAFTPSPPSSFFSMPGLYQETFSDALGGSLLPPMDSPAPQHTVPLWATPPWIPCSPQHLEKGGTLSCPQLWGSGPGGHVPSSNPPTAPPDPHPQQPPSTGTLRIYPP